MYIYDVYTCVAIRSSSGEEDITARFDRMEVIDRQ